MTLTLMTGPASEPVDLADMKLHLRVDTADEDALISGLIAAARLTVEAHASLALLTQSWRWTLDRWPGGALDLPLGPVVSVDQASVDGTLLSPDAYQLVPGGQARLLRADSTAWPAPSAAAGGIVIEFTAGFGLDGVAVPRDLRHAIMMLVAHWFENREPAAGFDEERLPRAVRALLAPYWRHRL
ncbi:MAG: head-tail connector protein [Parvibaculaceae bacterium]